MGTGSSMTKSDKGLSASLLAGSEEVFDFFCHPCSKENRQIEAAGFCTVCKNTFATPALNVTVKLH